MRRAIQDASEADESASNIVVFGLPEAEDEKVTDSIGQVLDAVVEKAHFV